MQYQTQPMLHRSMSQLIISASLVPLEASSTEFSVCDDCVEQLTSQASTDVKIKEAIEQVEEAIRRRNKFVHHHFSIRNSKRLVEAWQRAVASHDDMGAQANVRMMRQPQNMPSELSEQFNAAADWAQQGPTFWSRATSSMLLS